MNTIKPPKSLKQLREANAHFPFPRYVLQTCDNALMLFCAGFYGKNDCVWVEEAGITNVTAVDIDQDKVNVMKSLYPDEWEFLVEDVYSFTAKATSKGLEYTLVVADVPLTQFESSRPWYKHWCLLSTKYVLITAEANAFVRAGHLPRDWKVKAVINRTSQSSWLFLCKR
jgi:hypothetical protein